MVPLVTDVEKKKRREKIKAKRRRRGKKAKPLPTRKVGTDQKHKEFKIVAFYDETQDHRLVSGTKGDHQVAGRLMRREAGRIHLDQADEKIGNVDGAPWIRNQVERQNLHLDALGLDFYHLSEQVHKARREIYGDEDETGKQWAADLLHLFKHEGYNAAWESLLKWRIGLKRGKRPARRQPAPLRERAIGHDPLSRIPRQRLADRQRPNGSDLSNPYRPVKGPGMRWDAPNAEAIMGIESLIAERPMEGLLGKSIARKGLGMPGNFATPTADHLFTFFHFLLVFITFWTLFFLVGSICSFSQEMPV